MIQSPMYGCRGGGELAAKNRKDTKRTSVPPPANEPPVLVSEVKMISSYPPPIQIQEPEPDSGRYTMIHKRRPKKGVSK